ncbi:MAG: endonuclease NucS [Nitrosarchaeum sp.]|nr:endonuclease NucS [Nitrosarchaeum sp.]
MSGTVEALYYQVYNSVLLGNSTDAKMYLDILRDEFEQCPQNFDILNDGRFEHLKQLGHAIDNGLSIKNFNYEADTADIEVTKDEEQVAEEKHLVKILCKHADMMRQLLKASKDFRIYNLEHPTQYGFVDIVAKDQMTMYLIEVKKSEARYQVISQIDKYMLDFRLHLILKLWTNVVGVVIANGFLSRVKDELVNLGVVPIKYTYKNNILRLSRV